MWVDLYFLKNFPLIFPTFRHKIIHVTGDKSFGTG